MKALVLFCLCATSMTIAQAQNSSRGAGWELGADLIYQDEADISFEGGTSAALEDDIGLAVTFAYRLNDRFELGFGLSWQAIGYRATLHSGVIADASIDVSGDLEAFTPRVWANVNLLRGPLTPYVSAGAGWSFVDTNIPNGLVQVGCWWDPWWGYVCTPYQSTKAIDAPAYDAGIGVRWDISPGYTFRLSYEKHWIDYDTTSSTPDFDQWKIGVSYRY